MRVTEILSIKDPKKIKNIKFTNPGLMSPDAGDKIKELFNILFKTKDKLYNAREAVRGLENSVKIQELELQRLSAFFEVEYETYNKEVFRETEGFGIRGLGNSILGEQSVV